MIYNIKRYYNISIVFKTDSSKIFFSSSLPILFLCMAPTFKQVRHVHTGTLRKIPGVPGSIWRRGEADDLRALPLAKASSLQRLETAPAEPLAGMGDASACISSNRFTARDRVCVATASFTLSFRFHTKLKLKVQIVEGMSRSAAW